MNIEHSTTRNLDSDCRQDCIHAMQMEDSMRQVAFQYLAKVINVSVPCPKDPKETCDLRLSQK